MKVADIGTEEGPGYTSFNRIPESYFTLIDSIGKKIEALKDITSRLGITIFRSFMQEQKDQHEI
jgi:16S rRNA G527 N7-methylase RsmG